MRSSSSVTAGGLTSSPLIALVSRLVETGECGAVLGLTQGLVTIEMLASSVLFSQVVRLESLLYFIVLYCTLKVYRQTVESLPGLVYIIMAGLTSLVWLLFILLLLLLLKHERKFGPV